MSWLPRGMQGAVCLSVDDVHPAPIAESALRHLVRLQQRHPQLKATLFTTPDWRSIDPFPNGPLQQLPEAIYRLDRHPRFCNMLRSWPGIEIAVHGLHHVGSEEEPIAEFAGADRIRCRAILETAMSVFASAGLPIVPGLCPPAWHATDELLDSMRDLDMRFVASARDLTTPIDRTARTNGSGLHAMSLIAPQDIGNIVHFTTNFQGPLTVDRAVAIIDAGGLLSIKAHLLSEVGSYKSRDGLNASYCDHLDRLFCTLEERYGDSLWWTSMGEIAA